MHLGSTLLSHKYDDADAQVSKWEDISSVLAFNASYSFYFGQLDGLIRALASKAETYGGGDKYEEVDFSWGLPLKFSRHRIQRVNATLLTGTAVNVSVDALLTTTELPYESVLVSRFQDGQQRQQNISGTYQETILTNIVVTRAN